MQGRHWALVPLVSPGSPWFPLPALEDPENRRVWMLPYTLQTICLSTQASPGGDGSRYPGVLSTLRVGAGQRRGTRSAPFAPLERHVAGRVSHRCASTRPENREARRARYHGHGRRGRVAQGRHVGGSRGADGSG